MFIPESKHLVASMLSDQITCLSCYKQFIAYFLFNKLDLREKEESTLTFDALD